jgi:hypothetical protein
MCDNLQEEDVQSSMSHQQLSKLAAELGVTDHARLDRVIDRLRSGADIGCTGIFRSPSQSDNSKDSYRNGRQVTDAIAAWIHKKFVYGPVAEDDLPATAKVNCILTREKPDGTVRIILNLSSPEGLSVNEGINIDDFPATMSSTEAWLRVLNKAGKGCWISKTDWADAYKHVAVKKSDQDLQWFEWGGRYFKELMLIFGSASSAGIFDDAAKIVLDLVCRLARFPVSMTCQHLDDICAASADKRMLDDFNAAFQSVAAQVGVRLAPQDAQDKAFGPQKSGTIFGVHYNTEEWTWSIPDKKLASILLAIHDALSKPCLSDKEVRSLMGKLINIKPLIPIGKFHADHLMAALADAQKSRSVTLSGLCKRQLSLWALLLKSCNARLTIPDTLSTLPAWSANVFTDAAGGTLEAVGRGVGGVLGQHWFYYPWSKKINAGYHRVLGKKMSRKLAALEFIGPLIALSCAAKILYKRPAIFWVDNAGAVGAWKKGYSAACPICTTVAKAISFVAAAIGAQVQILKIRRCSDVGPTLADHLSKAKFVEFRRCALEQGWPLDCAPLTIPTPLLQWLVAPVPDDDLGGRIVSALAANGLEVLGHHGL